jgi:hypothetical protein
MTRSEFLRALGDEFGDVMAHSVSRHVVLGPLGNLTATEALDAGLEPKVVWAALCEAMDVPPNRRHGAGLREPLDGHGA